MYVLDSSSLPSLEDGKKSESFHVLSKTIASVRSFQKLDEQLRARKKIATLSRKEDVSQVLTSLQGNEQPHAKI